MAEPRMRATNYLSALKVLKTLPPAKSSAVLARLKPEELERLQRAGAMDWLAPNEFLPLVRAIHANLDPTAFEAFWRKNSSSAMEHPLLAGAVGLVAKLTGMGPRTVVKSIQNSWGLLSKDAGKMVPKDIGSETSMELNWENIPAELLHEPGYVGAFAPGFSAAFALLKTPVTVHLKLNPAAHAGTFTFDWKK